MEYQMDKVLRECVEYACELARLGRSGGLLDRSEILAEVLIQFEGDGNAMRYVNSKGRIAWKATPQLRDFLEDLRLDAEADLSHAEV
jgi:hypothetical protein